MLINVKFRAIIEHFIEKLNVVFALVTKYMGMDH